MHMPWSPLRSAVLGAAALTVMAATAVPAQADPQLWIGLQAPGVNGGNITPFAGGTVEYGHFGVRPAGGFASGQLPTAPPLLADAMVVSVDTPGTLIVWITITGYLPLGAQALESSFTQNQLPEGWTVRVFCGALHLQPNVVVPPGRVEVGDHFEPASLRRVVDGREEVEEVEGQRGVISQELRDLLVSGRCDRHDGMPVGVLDRDDVLSELGEEAVGDLSGRQGPG